MTATLAAVMATAAGQLGEHVGDVLDRVGGVLGAAAREARALPRAERAAAVATWRRPAPPTLGHIHPSWLEAALAELPLQARAVVAGDAALDEVGVWLARWACAELPPAEARGPRLEAGTWLAAVGADQMAFALGELVREAPSALVRDAAARIAVPPRRGHLGPRRAAIARCRIDPDDDLGLARIGARAVAPHLADDPVARRQLVVGLSRPDGLAISAELEAHAFDALADAPTWDALVGSSLG